MHGAIYGVQCIFKNFSVITNTNNDIIIIIIIITVVMGMLNA